MRRRRGTRSSRRTRRATSSPATPPASSTASSAASAAVGRGRPSEPDHDRSPAPHRTRRGHDQLTGAPCRGVDRIVAGRAADQGEPGGLGHLDDGSTTRQLPLGADRPPVGTGHLAVASSVSGVASASSSPSPPSESGSSVDCPLRCRRTFGDRACAISVAVALPRNLSGAATRRGIRSAPVRGRPGAGGRHGRDLSRGRRRGPRRRDRSEAGIGLRVEVGTEVAADEVGGDGRLLRVPARRGLREQAGCLGGAGQPFELPPGSGTNPTRDRPASAGHGSSSSSSDDGDAVGLLRGRGRELVAHPGDEGVDHAEAYGVARAPARTARCGSPPNSRRRWRRGTGAGAGRRSRWCRCRRAPRSPGARHRLPRWR